VIYKKFSGDLELGKLFPRRYVRRYVFKKIVEIEIRTFSVRL